MVTVRRGKFCRNLGLGILLDLHIYHKSLSLIKLAVFCQLYLNIFLSSILMLYVPKRWIFDINIIFCDAIVGNHINFLYFLCMKLKYIFSYIMMRVCGLSNGKRNVSIIPASPVNSVYINLFMQYIFERFNKVSIELSLFI